MVATTNVLFAQPTITSNFNPTFGYTAKIVMADTMGVTEGAAGANLVYDFSSLSQVGNEITYDYILPANTPYGSKYPGATLSFLSQTTTGGAGFTYLKTSASGYEILGVATAEMQLVYSNSQVFAQYPVTYNSTFTDNFAGQGTNTQGFTTHRKGTSTSVADAWGTLKLPQGTFTNVLRIKTTQEIRDSINFMGTDFVSVSRAVSYSFFRDDIQQQLLTINYLTFVDPLSGNESTSKTVMYYPETATNNPSSVQNAEKAFKGDIYPNPATNQITFSPQAGATHYTITNVLGKLYNSQPIVATEPQTVDVSALPQGIYTISLYNGTILLGTQKFTLVK